MKEAGAYSAIHGVVFGNGGSIDRLRAEIDIVYTPASPVGAVSGRIIDSGAK